MSKRSLAGQVREGVGVMKALLSGLKELKQEARRLGLNTEGMGRAQPHLREAPIGDPYAILGIEPDAPDKMVKEIYLLKAVWYHPDSNRLKGWSGNEAHFKRISAAFEAIKRKRGMK
jgi:DnaJ-class molecular chaperone